MATPDRPWIYGIRPRRIVGAAWQSLVQAILTREFVKLPNGARTVEAETGLGLPACVYFYVFQTSSRFGSVVSLWHENPAVPFKANDGAVAPFDTGGIWHERVITEPLLAVAERRPFVATHSRSADVWLQELVTWIDVNYAGAVQQYLDGDPPRHRLPSIVYDSRNEGGAWTWEARLAKTEWRDQMLIRHLFWSRDDRTAFEEWLTHDSTTDTKVAEDLIGLIRAISVETPRGEQASVEVARYLMSIA